MSNIDFKASEVEYSEAIDGEIVQVSFDEDPGQGAFDRTKCYVIISQNHEFPGTPTVEWHDGETGGGGAEVQSYRLTKDLFELIITDGVKFRVKHDCKEETFVKIRAFLQHEFGNSKQH